MVFSFDSLANRFYCSFFKVAHDFITILLIFFINYPSSLLICSCLLTDYLKLFSVSSTIGRFFLQSNLDTLVHWCNLNRLTLNINKYHSMHCLSKPPALPLSALLIDILYVISFQDVGVTFKNKLHFYIG